MADPARHAVGTAVASANSVANPTTLAATAPAGRSTGDVLFCITWCRSITATVATPAGWNLVSGFPKRSGTASGGSYYVFSRTADGTSADNCSPSWSGVTTGTTSGDSSQAIIIAYSGLTETLDGTVQVADLASQTTTSTIPAFTTGTNNSMVIGAAVKWIDSTGTSTVSTFSESSDESTTTGSGHIAETSDLAKTGLSSAGSSGTATVTWSVTTSARVLAISFGFKSVMPTGAAATSLTLPLTAAGVRKAVGAAARPETLTYAAAGVRTTLGAAARAETITFAAAGTRTRLGAATRSQTLTLTAAGFKATSGVAARAETLTLGAAGIRTTVGAAARAETINCAAAGVRTGFGTASEPLTVAFAAAGIVTTPAIDGAADFDLAFTQTVVGVRTVLGSAALAASVTLGSSGVRTARGAASFTLTLDRAAAATRSTFGAAALGDTVTLHAAGVRAASSAAALPLQITLVASAANIGAAAFGLTFDTSTTGERETFGAAHLVEQDSLTANGHAGRLATAVMNITLPLHASGHTTRSGAADLPLALVFGVAAFNAVIGGPIGEGDIASLPGRLLISHERRGSIVEGRPGVLAVTSGRLA